MDTSLRDGRLFKGGTYLMILYLEWTLIREARLYKGGLNRGIDAFHKVNPYSFLNFGRKFTVFFSSVGA